ncbi:hypothetical protein J8L85_11220 [Maribacter sp. MMG018]|uniref:leucine-rich repeat domain-containing protein n=1 Tax=Maribacter sp. MMG018 TaxID=2822688 RepID=UPI001B36A3B3|nr:hypothetical protein [Maribacter sp. MMG018]MBQ4915011.1 hypothetical protein [Maribacter sp. MMG018]
MKKMWLILLLSFFTISCSSDSDDPTVTDDPTKNDPIVESEGGQIFRIDLMQITAKNQSEGIQKSLEPAFVLLSINNSSGDSILTKEKVALIKDDNSYITNEITLEPDTYTVVEFIVTDENDVVISIAPKENSTLAQFTTKPLPFDFVITSDETTETVTESINAAGYASVDFGYTGLSLTISESTDFFSLTVDETEGATTKVLDIKSITGSTYLVDWGDGTIDEYVSTISNSGIDNTISHSYSQNEVFTIKVSGAIEAIELINFEGSLDDDYKSNLTTIDLEKLTLLKTCKLYNGKLTSLNTSQNNALEILWVSSNQISELDLTNNSRLKQVFARDNNLSSIDFSNNLNLEQFDFANNTLMTIDISSNSNLKNFDVSNNLISAIDISSNVALTEINIGANNLQNIDLTKNTNLVRVDLFTNELTALDVSANTKLRDLYVENNNLTEIELSSNPDLERLYIKNNNLNDLDISLNTKISDLNIGDNQFDEAELDEIINLVYDHTVANAIMNGYINYLNNPGTSAISNVTISNMNDLIVNYNWFFNNG